MALTTADGRALALESNVSPYVLAGATRRWRILTPSFAPAREALRLTAQADAGAIDQAVSATSAPP
jgi:fimbrial chaperone protein